MQARCPHCHTPIDLDSEGELSDIVCPSCGSSFSLLGADETSPYEPGATRTIGHFELVEQIGMGSFGSVWRARDTELERLVAVKIPRKGQLSPEETEQFLREARAAAQLRHPDIVTVHEVGRADDTVFIVSDFVEGVTLADRLTAQSFSIREAAELCAKIADALHHAHEQGVIHRDLKPGNIILDADGEPHIMDFGLARREVGDVTMTVEGRVLGTPAYMSPEQAKGSAHSADRRSDVYSLGVILFELLTGERPFRGNPRMLLHQVVHDDAPSPRRLNGSVPRDLETICLKCLEKERGRRYTTAQRLADDLRRFVDGKPIEARPIARLERGWRWCKRKPVVAALSATVLGLLVAIIVAAPLMVLREKALRREAQRQANAVRRQAFVSDMNFACQALEQNNFACVRDILNRNRLELKSSGYRGFDWYFLQRMCDQTAERRIDLPYIGGSVEFSPDDDWLAVRLVNRRVLVVRVNDLSVEESFGPGDRMWSPGAIAFVASKNRLAYSFGYGIRIRDVGTAIPNDELIYDGEVKKFAFSRDGNYLAIAPQDGAVRILTTKDSESVRTLSAFEQNGAHPAGIAWSPEEEVLACAFEDGAIRVGSVDGDTPMAELSGHTLSVGKLAFSPGGRFLASGANDGLVKVWDWRTRKCLHTLSAHADRIYALQFSPDGRLLALGSRDNTISLWDVSSFQQVCILRGHSAAVVGLGFSHQGNLLASVSSDRSVLLWDLSQKREPEVIHVSPNKHVTDLEVSSDGQTLAAICGHDKFLFPESAFEDTQKVRLWNLATGVELDSLHVGRNVFSMTFSSKGLLFTGAVDGQIDLWDLRTGRRVRPLSGHEDNVRDLAISPDGKTLVSGSDDGSARVWDISRGIELYPRLAHGGRVRAVAVSPDGSLLATGGDDQDVALWDLGSGEFKRALPGHQSAVLSVAFSTDGRWLAASSWDDIILAWDLTDPTPEPETLSGHSMWVSSVMFHDERTLLSTSGDHRVKIWDVELWQQRFAFNGHSEAVMCLAISPDRNLVATASRDGTIHLWRAAPGF